MFEKQFKALKEKNYWSDLIVFNNLIMGKKLSKITLARYFNKMVDKSDYSKSDKEAILAHSNSLTNPKTD
jgi:hypothetical protein